MRPSYLAQSGRGNVLIHHGSGTLPVDNSRNETGGIKDERSSTRKVDRLWKTPLERNTSRVGTLTVEEKEETVGRYRCGVSALPVDD